MDEDTTTPAPADTGVDETQPVVAETTAAVESTTTATEEQTEAAETGASTDDAELDDWASKKGLELDSDNARKAAKMAREAERAMHQKAQRASELEKATQTVADDNAEAEAAATGQDPELLKRVQRVEVKEAVRDFWSNPDHDRSMESKMVEVLQQKPYLAGDLDSLYAVAVMKSGSVDAVKSQARKDTLSELAQKQQAAVPKGNATTRTAPKEKPFSELSISEMEQRLGKVRR